MARLAFGDLAYTLPDQWSDASLIMSKGPAKQGSGPSNFLITREPPIGAETAEAAAIRIRETAKEALTDLGVVASGPRRFGGLDGYLNEMTFVIEGIPMAQLQFVVIRGGELFAFTYTATQQALGAERAIADQLFSSVELGAA